MLSGWSPKRVLITVRTYPVPARNGVEVSCTAGVTDQREWIRLFPIPYRFLTPDKRFTKYQWIDVDVTRPRNDPRPDSFTLRLDTLRTGATVSPSNEWRSRKEIVFPLKRNSLCEIALQCKEGGPTLGIFKPGSISKLFITPAKPATWTPPQLAILNQQRLGFESGPTTALEKIPFDFTYQFRCAYSACKGLNWTPR
jgi:hypothetical protein